VAYLCGFDFSTVAPKPRAEGSSPSAPAIKNDLNTAFKPFFYINNQAERGLKYHF